MTDIDLAKRALRGEFRARREAIAPALRAQRDEAIARRLFESGAYRSARGILCYVSYQSEIDTRAILCRALRDGKRVAAPRVDARVHSMAFYELAEPEDLVGGYRGIPEPREGLPSAQGSDFSLCILPGYCFDGRGYRLGYGGGYYDRFLANFGGRKLGLCYRENLVSSLPHDRYDIPADLVICEDGEEEYNAKFE
ncbi:5-formyltetrahydrofolate cyclo-ligase [Feifania hominis]|uniref:5-formyltetrahydrofolate cyclo-ligase n=1 Tax=Feifania hominis TaxID=2763660 RepID=A0A926HTF3_9FIRM|nr:5-formyltetrahydrofolate cyclo-ligase [Feifania hominis]MBC8535248.1 5-formyltetrahydrofolate cyclo-ligase [Feifania hominis]